MWVGLSGPYANLQIYFTYACVYMRAQRYALLHTVWYVNRLLSSTLIVYVYLPCEDTRGHLSPWACLCVALSDFAVHVGLIRLLHVSKERDINCKKALLHWRPVFAAWPHLPHVSLWGRAPRRGEVRVWGRGQEAGDGDGLCEWLDGVLLECRHVCVSGTYVCGYIRHLVTHQYTCIHTYTLLQICLHSIYNYILS